MIDNRFTFGVVGGLGALAGADFLQQLILLGCTELPLLFPQTENFDAAGQTVALLDPTLLLASACVRHAPAAST
jgi:aspartate/glutamate racemase